MMPPKPSALRVAMLRAAHQLLDVPVVFEDPLAFSILGAEGEALRGDRSRCEALGGVGFRAALVLRGRVAEDQWAQARQYGVRQYVILGAGLETFAYRNRDHGRFRVFEVDLPAVIRWKRECLRLAGIREPAALAFVPADFERASLARALKYSGFDPGAPAFFSCLGVTMYLDEEAVMRTLRFVASLATGSGVVFDYAVHPSCLPPREKQVMAKLDKRMAEVDEPWKTHLDPTSLSQILRAMGFTEVCDFGPEELNARYLSGRTDGLRKGGITRIVHARV